MSDVTGPISTLPGSVRSSPENTKCDKHPDRLAVKRVQGETDSFGSEMFDVCQECYDEHRKQKAEPNPGRCDWCKEEAGHLVFTRDYDEGSCGRLYSVCQPCKIEYSNSIVREYYDEPPIRYHP